MKYILYVYGYDIIDGGMLIECADAEDLVRHTKSALLDERVEKVVAKKVKERKDK